MRCVRILLLISSLMLCSIDLPAQGINPATDFKPVKILFTAIDKDKKPVSGIEKDDVRLLADGTPQNISSLEIQTNVPTSFAIILDISISQEKFLPLTKVAARAFVKGFIRQGQDQAVIVTMAERALVEQPLTDDVEKLQSAINKVKFIPPSGYAVGGMVVGNPSAKGKPVASSTGLWDGLFFTCEKVLSQSQGGTRKAIILFSDGVDTSSQLKMSKAIDQSSKQDVAVYSVGIGDEREFGIERHALQKLSERTGGRAYFPQDKDELQTALNQIAQELRSQYVLTFVPTPDKAKEGYRKLKIEITDSAKKKGRPQLAYRQAYFPER